uniref:Uncharacterized protein n=1 Tax=Macrostomum lignano TaxID=282301 RepID=A0A1I8FHP2_9PLAT
MMGCRHQQSKTPSPPAQTRLPAAAGAQQASVRCVNLFLERLRQRPGLGVVTAGRSSIHRLEANSGAALWRSEKNERQPRQAFGTARNAETPKQGEVVGVAKHAEPPFRLRSTHCVAATESVSGRKLKTRTRTNRNGAKRMALGNTARWLVACPFKQNSCDLDAQHHLKSIQPQKELHFKEGGGAQQQLQQQQHACQNAQYTKKCNFESSCLVQSSPDKVLPGLPAGQVGFKVGMKREWILNRARLGDTIKRSGPERLGRDSDGGQGGRARRLRPVRHHRCHLFG